MRHFYAVVGAGGCGRGILPILREQLSEELSQDAELVLVDDSLSGKVMNGHRVIGQAEFVATPALKTAVVGIANSAVRAKVVEDLEAFGVEFMQARAANSVIMDSVAIGEGACLSPFVTLTANIQIGRHFHANLYSYVEHDCHIGDFVTFAPGVQCNGNVHIEDHAYIGAGAMIKQGIPGAPLIIGAGAVVGMGAVVTRSVDPGVTVVGNPARRM